MLLWKAGAISRKWYLFVVREQYLDASEMARIRVWYMREAGDVLKYQSMRSFKSFKEIALWWLSQNVQIFMGIRSPGSSKTVAWISTRRLRSRCLYTPWGWRLEFRGLWPKGFGHTKRPVWYFFRLRYFNGNLYSELTLTMWSTILHFSFCFSLASPPPPVISSGHMGEKA